MIYIFNTNKKFKKQIEYAFINIFFVLGLDCIFIKDDIPSKIMKHDILILYSDNEEIKIQGFKNVITVKPSNKLFNDNYLKSSMLSINVKNYKDIISIFSKDEKLYINEAKEEKNLFETNIDLVSDIFFMLTRYEEVVNSEAYEKEMFNRFPAKESTAFKNNFLHRPIVNEHIDLIWSFIDKLNLGYKKKKWWGEKDFAACLTHDVDIIQKHKKFKDIIRTTGSLLIKQKRPVVATKSFFNYLRGYKHDPYYTFDYIIGIEKQYNFKSSFYFMSGGTSKFDNFYDINEKKSKTLVEQIENIDFEAGYHCSLNSYNNLNLFLNEVHKLNYVIKKKPYGCRQHFLRFHIPFTWRIQEKAGLLYDTTLGFADAEGFRCGTCFPFKPYDLLEDRVLDIWEIPLIVMDGSLQNKAHRAYSSEEGLQVTKNLIDTVRKYKGVFTLLYHNSALDYTDESLVGWKDTYEKTMKYLNASNCIGITGEEIINMMIDGNSRI